MRGIATALYRQMLRKRFPEGVSMFVHQTGRFSWKLRIICLKRERLNESCVVGTFVHRGSEYGIAILTKEMCRIAKMLREAGVTPVITPKL